MRNQKDGLSSARWWRLIQCHEQEALLGGVLDTSTSPTSMGTRYVGKMMPTFLLLLEICLLLLPPTSGTHGSILLLEQGDAALIIA
jgi:hypothetical protein